MMGGDFRLSVLTPFASLGQSERRATFIARIDPPAVPERRPPLGIVLALDTSSSMARDKLEHAIASARAVVAALSATDTFACVAFATKTRVLVRPTPTDARGKEQASRLLGSARADGNTNLGAAILDALDLAGQIKGGARVLLLTDGCPTEGILDERQLTQLARAGKGTTVSTFGFGRDVNPALLAAIADAGHGGYTFIETGEAPVSAIAAELGGLLATVAEGVRLSFKAAPGVRIERVHRLSGLTVHTEDLELSLPPLVAEEPASLVFELSWTEAAAGKPLGLVTLRAHATGDGTPVAREATVVVAHTPGRGAVVPEAAREVVLARAAVVLGNASAALSRPARDVAAALAEHHAELRGEAGALGVADDPQVAAALAMIADARHALATRERDARQDLVASAASVRDRKSTSMGPAAQRVFVTRAQKTGMDLLGVGEPPSPPAKKR